MPVHPQNHLPQPPAAVILAGGESRRFGSDKAMYRIDGRSMLERVYDAVSSLSDDVMVSVRRGTSIPTEIDARIVYDRVPGRGPLAGIDAAFAVSRCDWLLVVACDMPFLTTTSLASLLAARKDTADACVAVDASGRLHPLCACYGRAAHTIVREQLSSSKLSMMGMLERLGAVQTVCLQDRVLKNLNVPDDADH